MRGRPQEAQRSPAQGLKPSEQAGQRGQLVAGPAASGEEARSMGEPQRTQLRGRTISMQEEITREAFT